jgi:hypothetical protein
VPTWKTRFVSFKTSRIFWPFINGEGQRFFAVNVFARLHGFDGDYGMPMIGSDDGNNLHIYAIKNFAIVFMNGDVRQSAFSSLNRFQTGGTAIGVLGIDIGNGHAITNLQCVRANGSPAISGANAADDWSVIGFFEIECLGGFRGKPERCCTGSNGLRF